MAVSHINELNILLKILIGNTYLTSENLNFEKINNF